MFASKKLTQPPEVQANSTLAADDIERDLETLKRNELIAGDEEIAQQILDESEVHTFSKGNRLIGEGEQADDVYFLLFGDVEVIRKGKGRLDKLSTPSTVGELAADEPGQPRTASVIASSNRLRTRVLPGRVFREIRDSNPNFASALKKLISNMNRRKIAQNLEQPFLAKVVKPLLTGCGSFLISALLFWNFTDLTTGQLLSLSALAAAIVVGLAMYFDHQHRYGRAFSMALLATILYGSHFGVSYFLFVDGRTAPFPFFWNFTANPEQSPLVASVFLAVLFLLCVVCGVFDYLRNLSHRQH
ncbi:cyclic nucleotide-binding domain-containing protein [uncultured Tateyamaria sp.]|uniref:cyclic nucleotide-binding domain-containing protein n=1 Tax=uncultured Tateyamaria sp. TaxID=455651 RepID=UPI0026237770|nr:cyclic nucleotide-binding domain-containing protein [uncultured Tateyamaria sp.]